MNIWSMPSVLFLISPTCRTGLDAGRQLGGLVFAAIGFALAYLQDECRRYRWKY